MDFDYEDPSFVATGREIKELAIGTHTITVSDFSRGPPEDFVQYTLNWMV